MSMRLYTVGAPSQGRGLEQGNLGLGVVQRVVCSRFQVGRAEKHLKIKTRIK